MRSAQSRRRMQGRGCRRREEDARPLRSENRAILVASTARGRRWLEELIADPTANTESREGCSVRKVNMTISLALGKLDSAAQRQMAQNRLRAGKSLRGDRTAYVKAVVSAFWALSSLVKAAIDGRLRYGLGVARFCDQPAQWSRQRQMLGLPVW
jgi:site-specific DNA recombinase